GDIHWDEWLAQREEVRRRVAAFINAEPDEVAFTINTSSGMNVIIDALDNHGEVISCDLEFPVSTLPWMNRRIPIHLVKSHEGRVSVQDLRDAMNVRSGVICLSHVQFSNGFRTDLEELGNAKGGHALVVNAAQSAGAFAIDVKRMKIDALCATGHKWLLSGYGSGFVYLSRELQAVSKPHAIGWLSLQDPFTMRNDEAHLRHDAAARARRAFRPDGQQVVAVERLAGGQLVARHGCERRHEIHLARERGADFARGDLAGPTHHQG
ncbi:MAG: aminotransferase class V-fold PLP-dependent enzyme, partial [Pyrinomonadaceae bacterium]